MGDGIVAMSKHCVVHAYDSLLQPFFRTPLGQAPEVRYGEERMNTSRRNLRNHIRAVALSPRSDAYLFTLADMGWLIDMQSGRARWGIQMPIKEGWREVPQAEGIGDRIVGRRYGKEESSFEVPLDLSDFGFDESPTLTFTTSSEVDESWAADWIGCATFDSCDDSIYFGTVSGKIVQVNSDGSLMRVFDIIGVPTEVVHNGEYLYVQTKKRLLVLDKAGLVEVVDRHEKSQLIVVERGFGLLGNRELQWFSPGGARQGSVLARHPIRRVYSAWYGLVLETRQHRGTVLGADPWWS